MSNLDEDRLRRLIEAGRSVVAERELERVLDRLLEVARELTGARYAALGVLDDAREGLADFITIGIDETDRRVIGDLPRGRGVLGQLISDPVPLRLEDVGDHPRSYGFPPGHPPMRGFLGVPILIRGEAWGNLYLTDKEGGTFDEGDEEAVVVLAAWAAIAVENARLYRETERRRAELERSVRAFEAASEMARAVVGETKLDRLLELIAKRARAVVEASALAILLIEGDELVVAATAGTIPRKITGSRIPAADSLAERVIRDGTSERISHLASAEDFALRSLGVEASAGIFAALQFRGKVVGVIEALDRVDGPDFLPDDERLLLAAAATAATAVATAQSVEQDGLRRSLRAAEDERRRWARELHDETLQALGGLRVLLSSTRSTEDPAALRGAIDRAVNELGDEISNLRALIAELRPAALDELGLRAALDSLIERMASLHGFDVTGVVELASDANPGASRLDPDLETTVYRIVQEAMTNAGRHAGADQIEVTVRELGDKLEVVIRDDGAGFDTTRPTSGFGVIGMGERVTLASGRIDIHSSDAGTSIAVTLPVTRRVKQHSA